MKYQGSKSRIANYIVPIIYEQIDKLEQGVIYIEPFMGGCNLLEHIHHPKIISKLAYDSNPYLVALYQALQTGWLPPDLVTETQYQKIKAQPELYPAYQKNGSKTLCFSTAYIPDVTMQV